MLLLAARSFGFRSTGATGFKIIYLELSPSPEEYIAVELAKGSHRSRKPDGGCGWEAAGGISQQGLPKESIGMEDLRGAVAGRWLEVYSSRAYHRQPWE